LYAGEAASPFCGGGGRRENEIRGFNLALKCYTECLANK